MIELANIVRRFSGRNLFSGPEGSVTYAQFAELVADASSGEQSEAVRSIRLDWSAESFAEFLALLLEGNSVSLVDLPPQADTSLFAGFAPLIILKTGGTTGSPKHVVHSAENLLGRYQWVDRPERRLLVLYNADHIAGLDAFFHALHQGATLVIPESRDPHAVIEAVERNQVEVLPATPTYLQFLLLSGALDRRTLPSVTAIPHGAEAMPPALRQRIKVAFPHARLIHRFGLTELGALPVREDPEDPDCLYLEGDGYAWKVEQGELWIQSPSRMAGTLEEGPVGKDSGWHATGDLAEETIRGSIRVIGRRESLINVGGEKILPETVEALLLEQEAVRDAAVFAVESPLTGQAVGAQVLFNGAPDPTGLMRSLRGAIRGNGLSLAHVPTKIETVENISKTAIGKRQRQLGKS